MEPTYTCTYDKGSCYDDGKCHYKHQCQHKVTSKEDEIRAMNHKELYDFLDSIAQEGPWYEEFDKKYCKNCETIEIDGNTYAFCEIEGNECPHGDVLEWWLKQPVEKENNNGNT